MSYVHKMTLTMMIMMMKVVMFMMMSMMIIMMTILIMVMVMKVVKIGRRKSSFQVQWVSRGGSHKANLPR